MFDKQCKARTGDGCVYLTGVVDDVVDDDVEKRVGPYER